MLIINTRASISRIVFILETLGVSDEGGMFVKATKFGG